MTTSVPAQWLLSFWRIARFELPTYEGSNRSPVQAKVQYPDSVLGHLPGQAEACRHRKPRQARHFCKVSRQGVQAKWQFRCCLAVS